MNEELSHNLSITVKSQPVKSAIEGESFNVIFEVKNIDENNYPGMNIPIRISWPILGINSTVNKLLAVGSLSSGEMREYSLEIQPLVAGFTFFFDQFSRKKSSKQ